MNGRQIQLHVTLRGIARRGVHLCNAMLHTLSIVHVLLYARPNACKQHITQRHGRRFMFPVVVYDRSIK